MSDHEPDTRNEILDDLLGDFLDESDQLLTQLNENLLRLDEWVQSLDDDHQERCDEGLLNEMFRAAHSIKGLSAMLGLGDINHLTHKIENVFDAARRDELTINADVVELMFAGLDQLVALVALLKEPGGQPVDCDAVLDAIHRLLQSAGAERKQACQADAERVLGSDLADCPPTPPEQPIEPAGEARADPFADVEDEEEIPPKYLSLFIDESELCLEKLTADLLALEGGGSGDKLRSLLGSAHKIKGSAASIGLNRVAKLAHLMEDFLQSLLDSGRPLSAGMVDVLLQASDALQQHVVNLKHGTGEADGFAELARRLLEAETGPAALDAPGEGLAGGAPEEPAEPARLAGALLNAGRVYSGQVEFQSGFPASALKALLIYEKLQKLGDVSHCDPPVERLDELDQLECFRFRVISDEPREKLVEQVRVAGVCEARIEPVDGGPSKGEAPGVPVDREAARSPDRPQAPKAARNGNERAGEGGARAVETVRVDIDRLDHLMDLAGQLVINKARFSQIAESLKTLLGCKESAHAMGRVSAELAKLGGDAGVRFDGEHRPAGLDLLRSQVRRMEKNLEPIRREIRMFGQARDSVRDLFEAIHQLDRISDGIQQSVMDTRMVPIGPLFHRFKRVVRDITRGNGKSVRLVINGEKTELDKRMIDELGDPLVHIVRNAADHGIEPPADREAAGKPREGTVTLDAFHRGNSIVIEVRDDGKGLDRDRILRKCLEKGILTAADAEGMTSQQIYQMIWEPGLSTAEKVTEVSGRGMGMDIVKSKIEELNGSVDVASEPGRGTTISIKLPLTLAILPSLMVEIGDDVFAMPMEAVAEIVSADREQLSTVHGRRVARVRGRVVSLARLDDLLRFHGRGRSAGSEPDPSTTLVIVRETGRELAVPVDRVLGEEDVVIKSIAENYKNVPGIAGASILGDGRVSLILDVAALVEMAAKRTATITA